MTFIVHDLFYLPLPFLRRQTLRSADDINTHVRYKQDDGIHFKPVHEKICVTNNGRRAGKPRGKNMLSKWFLKSRRRFSPGEQKYFIVQNHFMSTTGAGKESSDQF